MRLGRRSSPNARLAPFRRPATVWLLMAFALVAGLAAPNPVAAQFQPPRIDRRGLSPTPPIDPFASRRPNPIRQSVTNRPRPALDPLGVPIGPTRFYPSADVGMFFDDNVRRAENGRDSDIGSVAAPAFLLLSDRPDFQFEAAVDATVYRHFHLTTEDRADISFAARGAYETRRDLYLLGDVRLARLHEVRASPDAFGAESPVAINLFDAGFGIDKRFGNFGVLAEAAAGRHDFRDVQLAPGNVNLNNDDRDRWTYRAALESSYRPFDDAIRAYGRLEANLVDYDAAFDDGGFGRDSQGLDGRIGALIYLSGATMLEAHVGYLTQFYEDDGRVALNADSISALMIGAAVKSNITGLTSVNARFDRSLKETTIAGGAGTVESLFEAGVDHELLRNFVLSAGASGRYSQFVGADREDLGLLFRFGGVYMFNRNIGLGFGFEHEDIRSAGTQEGVDLSSNRIMLRVTARP